MTIGLLYWRFLEDGIFEGQYKMAEMSFSFPNRAANSHQFILMMSFAFWRPFLASLEVYRVNKKSQRGSKGSSQLLRAQFCFIICFSAFYSGILNLHCNCVSYSPVAPAFRSIQMMWLHMQDYSSCTFWYSVIFFAGSDSHSI